MVILTYNNFRLKSLNFFKCIYLKDFLGLQYSSLYMSLKRYLKKIIVVRNCNDIKVTKLLAKHNNQREALNLFIVSNSSVQR